MTITSQNVIQKNPIKLHPLVNELGTTSGDVLSIATAVHDAAGEFGPSPGKR